MYNFFPCNLRCLCLSLPWVWQPKFPNFGPTHKLGRTQSAPKLFCCNGMTNAKIHTQSGKTTRKSPRAGKKWSLNRIAQQLHRRSKVRLTSIERLAGRKKSTHIRYWDKTRHHEWKTLVSIAAADSVSCELVCDGKTANSKQRNSQAVAQYQAGSDRIYQLLSMSLTADDRRLPLQRSEVQVRCNSPASIKNLKINPARLQVHGLLVLKKN